MTTVVARLIHKYAPIISITFCPIAFVDSLLTQLSNIAIVTEACKRASFVYAFALSTEYLSLADICANWAVEIVTNTLPNSFIW